MSGAPAVGVSLDSVVVWVGDVAVEAARRVGVFEGLDMDFVPRPRVWLRLIWVRVWQSVHALRWDALLRPCRVDVTTACGVAERHKDRARRGAWSAILEFVDRRKLEAERRSRRYPAAENHDLRHPRTLT